MAFDAFKTSGRFVVVVQLFIEHLLVTTGGGARGKDGNVRFETPQRRGFRDVDMTGGAFAHVVVLFSAALVPELH
jgi:hypothetical protein